MKNFGLDRVVSPKDVLPVAAWKLDNDMNLRHGEARLAVDRIHVETDNFHQICSSCGYEKDKIKAKIYDLLDKRGKFHNPYTKTGGVLIGVVRELGPGFNNDTELELGQRVYVITSTCGLPMVIDEILDIDFQYGQIVCRGEVIVFDTSPIELITKKRNEKYTLAAMDEAGNLFGLYNMVKDFHDSTAVIIGKTVYTTMLYAQAIREGLEGSGTIIAIMDKTSHYNAGSHRLIEDALAPMVDETYFVDLVRPMEAFREITPLKDIYKGMADHVIVIEDVYGAESLAVSLVKPKGDIYFSSVGNHYGTASITAEGLGKEIVMHVFDQYAKEHPQFTFNLVDKIAKELENADQLFRVDALANDENNRQLEGIGVRRAGDHGGFIYQSIKTKQMVDEVLNIAKYDCNMIIQGETGVGKERVLDLIHQNSTRCSGPCIKINCATIHENLAESEFFGYEKGAFTGASHEGKRGYFEMANNGILFLDEIGALPIAMQSKLLRAIQESQFYRVGGSKPVSVNVRVIVANNVPLRQLVDEGKFREDLYYRLNICTIDVPPLRDRREDIICLAESFVERWSKKYGVDKHLSTDALRGLYYYNWMGNVRELENVIHRLVISSREDIIGKDDIDEILSEEFGNGLDVNARKELITGQKLDFHSIMDNQERTIIAYALNEWGTTRKAAAMLGLPQTTFARKKLKYGL